jgi:hypothetical protein
MAEVVVFGVVAADVILRIPRIPAPGDHVSAEALGWCIGGSSANVACGLSTAGHHVRLVGPVGADSMGDHLLAELSRCGVDTGCPGDRGPARRAAETRTCHHHKVEGAGTGGLAAVLAGVRGGDGADIGLPEGTPRLADLEIPQSGLDHPLDAPTSVAKFSAVSCRRWSRRTGTHGSERAAA